MITNLTSSTLITPKGKSHIRPAVLFIHGWRGDRSKYVERAKDLAALGFTCLAFDLRGHGGASEDEQSTITRVDNLNDAVAAYDLLAHNPFIDPSAITVFGSSYGGYLAMLLAGKRNVARLILRAPALYRDSGFGLPAAGAMKDVEAYRARRTTPGRNLALKSIRGFTGDALIIASENDEFIPFQSIENIRNACEQVRSPQVKIIRGADHRLSKPTWGKQANKITNNWLIATNKKRP
jgi:uncharacterized protein